MHTRTQSASCAGCLPWVQGRRPFWRHMAAGPAGAPGRSPLAVAGSSGGNAATTSATAERHAGPARTATPTGAAPWGRLPPCRGPCPGRPAGRAGRPGPPALSRRASRSASAAACRAVPSPGSRARCRVTVSSQASAGCQAGASLCSGARSPTHTTPAACSGLLSWYGEGCWGSGRWSPSTARLFLCRPGSPCWLAKHTAAPNVVTQAVAAGRHACVRPPPGACASAAAVRAAPARLRTGEAQGRAPRRGHQQRMVGHVVQYAPGGRGQGGAQRAHAPRGDRRRQRQQELRRGARSQCCLRLSPGDPIGHRGTTALLTPSLWCTTMMHRSTYSVAAAKQRRLSAVKPL